MTVRKSLEQVRAAGGRFDRAAFESLTDSEIEDSIDRDPELAPRTETLVRYFEAGEIRNKLGLTQQQFARKLGIPVSTLRAWESDGTPADPLLQALFRILDRLPEAVFALDEPSRHAG